MKVLILVRSEQRGFYVGLGRELLGRGLSVSFVVDGAYNKTLVDDYFSENSNIVTYVLRDYRQRPTVRSALIEEATLLEKKYNITISSILAEDRALGRGYHLNIDNYPEVARAYWTGDEKVEHLVREIEQAERLFSEHDIVLSQYPEAIMAAVCDRLGVRHFHLSQSKFGDRYFWSSDGFQKSKGLEEKIEYWLANTSDSISLPEYERDGVGKKLIDNAQYSRRFVVRQIANIVFRDSVNWLRRKRKRDTYRLFGWIKPTYMKRSNFLYVSKNSTEVTALGARKIFLFPLHVEPEVSLLRLAPEFSNTIEALVWVSKSLPADCILAVKEQPNTFSVRSRAFYKRLASIGNVILVPPGDDSWIWVEKATAVVVFTGTVGFEAVNFFKPVISFGFHHVINQLPTVQFVTNMPETKRAVNRILDGEICQGVLDRACFALRKAQLESSFDLSEFAYARKATSISEATLALSAEKLIDEINFSDCSKNAPNIESAHISMGENNV